MTPEEEVILCQQRDEHPELIGVTHFDALYDLLCKTRENLEAAEHWSDKLLAIVTGRSDNRIIALSDEPCNRPCGHVGPHFVAPNRPEAAYILGPDGHGVATGGNVDHDALRDALEAWLRRKFLGQPDAPAADATDTASGDAETSTDEAASASAAYQDPI